MDTVKVALLRRALLPAIAALLLVPAYPPLGLWWLAWLALAPFYRALTYRGVWGGAAAGFCFGFTLFFVGMYWMTALATPLWVALAIIQGTFFALFAAVLGATLPRLPAPWRPAAFAAGWVLFEWVRSLGVYAFPWFLLASSQTRPAALPLLQSVAVFGQWGLSFAIALANGGVAEALRSRRPRDLALTLAVPLALYVPGWLALRNPPGTRPGQIVVVQGNENREADWNERLTIHLDTTRETLKTLPAPPLLVVFPEGAVRAEHLSALAALTEAYHTPILAGMIDHEGSGETYRPINTAQLVLPGGGVTLAYIKQRLAPFGEVYPWRRALSGVYMGFGVSHDSYISGERPVVWERPGLGTFGALICYESAFPWVARGLARAGAQTLFVLTSDQIYDGTPEIEQHLDLAAVRAVETGRPVIRAASTGISASIDAQGRRVATLANGKRGGLVVQAPAPGGDTLCLKWGDWWIVACFGIAAGAIVRAVRAPASPSDGSGSAPAASALSPGEG